MMANRVLRRLGDNLTGKRIALWGLAFKPKTDDICQAPALTIARRLLNAGAEGAAYDPQARTNAEEVLAGYPGIRFGDSPYAVAEDADAIVLATEWAEFRFLDFARIKKAMRSPLFFDGRNQYDPAEMKRLGFEYFCVGRPG
jgi:UDPglucose 6-dehydrogenase